MWIIRLRMNIAELSEVEIVMSGTCDEKYAESSVVTERAISLLILVQRYG